MKVESLSLRGSSPWNLEFTPVRTLVQWPQKLQVLNSRDQGFRAVLLPLELDDHSLLLWHLGMVGDGHCEQRRVHEVWAENHEAQSPVNRSLRHGVLQFDKDEHIWEGDLPFKLQFASALGDHGWVSSRKKLCSRSMGRERFLSHFCKAQAFLPL